MEALILLIVITGGVAIIIYAVWENHATKEAREALFEKEASNYPVQLGKSNCVVMYNNNARKIKVARAESYGVGVVKELGGIYVSQCFIAGTGHCLIKGKDFTGIGNKHNSAFILDDKNEKVHFISIGDNIDDREINFADIVSVQICEDGKTIYSKSTMRTVGGAIVGGAIAGGAGTVVGGLSGNSEQKRKIRKVTLKVLIRDLSENCFEFVIYEGIEISTTSVLYPAIEKYAEAIKDCISVIIDMEDKKHANDVSPIVHVSIADELAKLADLKAKGILSEDEFNQQKTKLLNS